MGTAAGFAAWYLRTGREGAGRAAVGRCGSRVKYLFVGGYMHSGTTLLRDVLLNLPGAVGGRGESKFFEFLPRLAALYPDLDDPATAEAFRGVCEQLVHEGFDFDVLRGSRGSTRGLATGGHVAVYLDVAREFVRAQGGSVFVEDTGTQVFSHREIAAAGPDAHLVTITRDVRDVLASKKTRRDTVFTDRYEPAQQQRKDLEKAYDPVWDALSWRTFARAADAAQRSLGPRCAAIRYEDLVIEPERSLQRLGAEVGVVARDEEVRVRVNNAADASLERSGIDARSVGRWHTSLPPEHARIATWLCRRELSALGYEIDGARLSGSGARLLVTSAGEPVVRVYRRARLGGVGAASAMTANYARRVLRSR